MREKKLKNQDVSHGRLIQLLLPFSRRGSKTPLIKTLLNMLLVNAF